MAKAHDMELVWADREHRRQVATFFDEIPFPGIWPAFSDLVVDKAGFPWVRE